MSAWSIGLFPSGNYRGGNNLRNNLVCIGIALARNSVQEGMGK